LTVRPTTSWYFAEIQDIFLWKLSKFKNIGHFHTKQNFFTLVKQKEKF